MDTYQLPQPAECVDFQNETMFINEGPLDIVIDFVGRIFKGSNSTSLAQQLFVELVIIQDRKLLIDSLIISNAHVTWPLKTSPVFVIEFWKKKGV
jgi:hypothetical protein